MKWYVMTDEHVVESKGCQYSRLQPYSLYSFLIAMLTNTLRPLAIFAENI